VLLALAEAHAKGIIHRDVKPENVFIAHIGGEVDVVKLLDFGVARTSSDTKLTITGFVAGTPAYMAPELVLGQLADVRSDLYSFGATLYFALTGRLPFPERDPSALFAAHLERAPEPISLLSPTPIPPHLERAVQCCMAKDPAERYPSAQALLQALSAPPAQL
jgi:serine/threonine-protein kinase